MGRGAARGNIRLEEMNKYRFEKLTDEKTVFLSLFLYPCDKQGCCNCVLDFFSVNNFVHRVNEICGYLQMVAFGA